MDCHEPYWYPEDGTYYSCRDCYEAMDDRCDGCLRLLEDLEVPISEPRTKKKKKLPTETEECLKRYCDECREVMERKSIASCLTCGTQYLYPIQGTFYLCRPCADGQKYYNDDPVVEDLEESITKFTVANATMDNMTENV